MEKCINICNAVIVKFTIRREFFRSPLFRSTLASTVYSLHSKLEIHSFTFLSHSYGILCMVIWLMCSMSLSPWSGGLNVCLPENVKIHHVDWMPQCQLFALARAQFYYKLNVRSPRTNPYLLCFHTSKMKHTHIVAQTYGSWNDRLNKKKKLLEIKQACSRNTFVMILSVSFALNCAVPSISAFVVAFFFFFHSSLLFIILHMIFQWVRTLFVN